MMPRSMGGIKLISKNERGSYYFMSIDTGRIIHVRQWTVLHITESVIGMVEQLSADMGINEMLDGEMLFEWKP